MKKFVATLLMFCLLSQQSFASQEGALKFSKFNIESNGIGSSGPIKVSGERNADGEFSTLDVYFAGQRISVPENISKNIPTPANGIQLNYLRYSDSRGGRTVVVVFQFGFTNEPKPVERYSISVSENGNVSVLENDPAIMQTDGDSPPFSPVNAATIVDDVSLNARCSSLIDQTLPRTEIRYAVVTQSTEWGRVWRADLYSFSTGQMGRIICWDPPEDSSDQVVHRAKYRNDWDRELPRR